MKKAPMFGEFSLFFTIIGLELIQKYNFRKQYVIQKL